MRTALHVLDGLPLAEPVRASVMGPNYISCQQPTCLLFAVFAFCWRGWPACATRTVQGTLTAPGLPCIVCPKNRVTCTSLTWLRRPNATLSRPPPSAGLNTTSLLIVTGAGAVERSLPSMTMPTESIPAATPPVVVSFVLVWRESDTGLLRGPEGVAAAKRRAGHRTLRVFRDAAVPPIQIARRPHPPYTGVGVGLSKRRG